MSSLISTPAAHAADATPLVSSFKMQAHVETAIPKPAGNYAAEILPAKIKDQDVIRLTKKAHGTAAQIVGVDLARGTGLAAIAWTVQLPDGRTFNLTGAKPASEIEAAYAKDSGNQFKDNLFFQNGAVATLFPMTNRLLGKAHGKDLIQAEVAGQTVVMPLNNTAGIKGAIPHHLHGLVYGELAQDARVDVSTTAAKVEGHLKVGPDLWTGQTVVTTTHTLNDRGYEFHLSAKNIGTTPVPVGAGAHPYFMSPDANHEAIRVHVPAKATTEINNLSDVLPTGKILKLTEADPALDFSAAQGTPLFAKEIKGNTTQSRLDNLWVDLEKDKDGYAYAEVFFPLSKFKVRMTALTKNVIGIQGYAPKFVEGKNPFVALELVTNLPDPRKDLWHSTPTGMQVLRPGETFDYGYRVELLPL